MQITDILFYIHSKNFTKLTYYYSFAFLILSFDSGLPKSSLTSYIEKLLLNKYTISAEAGWEYHHMGLQFSITEMCGNLGSHWKYSSASEGNQKACCLETF